MRKAPPKAQLDLFGNQAIAAPSDPGGVKPAAHPPERRQLGSQLSNLLYLGGSTWSFPGWAGHVYDSGHTTQLLAQEGLAAYAQHPLLRSVGIDRTFYAPLAADAFREYARQVPDNFRFIVKAHEASTLSRFPQAERYGPMRGLENPQFLDAAYATEQVVKPTLEGLGEKLGLLLFQFPPQDIAAIGGVDVFINRLYRFLRSLPPGVLYAVEVRNSELLTSRYAQAIEHAAAVPVLAGWNRLPPLVEQAALTRALDRPALFIRWMLRWGRDHSEAEAEYLPFDRLVDPDLETRGEILELARAALAAHKPVFITAGNTAEGCSPLTLEALAKELMKSQ